MLISLINNINTDWKNIFNKYESILKEISNKLENEKETYEPCLQILPPNDKIFSAFTYFNIDELKVVFVGQDCYHGKGQANGLCFSVPDGLKIPPSLRNIMREISDDLGIERTNSDFSDLASQGILFLNSALTVREKCPESHIPFWSQLTDNILKEISDNCENVIFVLWGNFAKGKKKFIDIDKHYILEAVHPSPLAANRGGFFGCKHFSMINKKLDEWQKEKIKWV